MLLRNLVTEIDLSTASGSLDIDVSGISYDSRAVRPGHVFVAVRGFTVDGHDYVDDACRRGAVVIVVERGRAGPGTTVSGECRRVEVEDTRRALSALAAAWHGRPARAMRVIGVTGTDGKTTTTYMTSAVLEGAGCTTGLMGTAEFKVGPVWEENATRQTTLEAPDVQALLARMRDGGVSHAVVESSSHGLALHKLDDCAFDVAVVTNITADHLDFHRTREAYWQSKARLLDLAAESAGKSGPRFVVLNADDSSFDFLRQRARIPVISYSVERPADLRGEIVEAGAVGSRVAVSGRWGRWDLWAPMAGPFNVSNALAATAVGLGHDLPVEAIQQALARFAGVPGRMNAVNAGQPFTVIVDYAHTGQAFRKLLRVLRPLTEGQLITVFGSAGEQSKERREEMADVAAELADFAVITTEDPRHENPDAIIADIAAGLIAAGREEGRDFVRVSDRREAIRHAFRRARPGDLVVLSGKGHEQSIIVRDQKLPWDERRVAEEELGRLRAPTSKGDSDG